MLSFHVCAVRDRVSVRRVSVSAVYVSEIGNITTFSYFLTFSVGSYCHVISFFASREPDQNVWIRPIPIND